MDPNCRKIEQKARLETKAWHLADPRNPRSLHQRSPRTYWLSQYFCYCQLVKVEVVSFEKWLPRCLAQIEEHLDLLKKHPYHCYSKSNQASKKSGHLLSSTGRKVNTCWSWKSSCAMFTRLFLIAPLFSSVAFSTRSTQFQSSLGKLRTFTFMVLGATACLHLVGQGLPNDMIICLQGNGEVVEFLWFWYREIAIQVSHLNRAGVYRLACLCSPSDLRPYNSVYLIGSDWKKQDNKSHKLAMVKKPVLSYQSETQTREIRAKYPWW